jgi:cholinesterase
MVLFLATGLLAAALANAQFTPGQTVKTTSGNVRGQPSSWKPAVSEYLGIPFAQPPVGPLRWAAPQKYNGAGKTIDATKPGAACLAGGAAAKSTTSGSTASATLGGAEGPQSEDCLFLNIYTKPQSGEKKKAVLLWIHGGAFIIGSGSNKGYNGALLAEDKDVVVVTFK